jgi:tRNA (guanine37-N1)-methyltransferase
VSFLKRNLKVLLEEKLSPEDVAVVYKSYDVIGDIAVVRIPEQALQHRGVIAEALMVQHKHVKSVWRQSGPVSGELRLRDLELIGGEDRTVTIHKEYGCLFKVDISKCYFSPRLAFERMRIAGLVGEESVVVNMFAGVGCYSIVIAKHSYVSKVYSIDVNSEAVEYMRENILLNKVVDKVIPLEGDARSIINGSLRGKAGRVLMPLPERAIEYLDSAVSAVKAPRGWIHYYGFEHASKGENPVEKAKIKATGILQSLDVKFEADFGRVVRQTGPNWHQLAIDILLRK